jgi:predicted methyltransferase
VAEGTLRWHEWEIAAALRDITDLRAEHEFNAAASAGPVTDAVLEPHQRALQLAQDAILSRVTALERYAAEVSAAGTAYRDWQDALRVSHLNDKYLDLVARTAADEHAVIEISGLTEQAAAAARAFRDTVRQVSLAAAALALPEPEAR